MIWNIDALSLFIYLLRYFELTSLNWANKPNITWRRKFWEKSSKFIMWISMRPSWKWTISRQCRLINLDLLKKFQPMKRERKEPRWLTTQYNYYKRPKRVVYTSESESSDEQETKKKPLQVCRRQKRLCLIPMRIKHRLKIFQSQPRQPLQSPQTVRMQI